MSFWNRKKTPKEAISVCDTGKVQKAKTPVKRNPPAPLEVKLLAMEALETGLTTKQVAEIVGVTDTTVKAWFDPGQEEELRDVTSPDWF